MSLRYLASNTSARHSIRSGPTNRSMSANERQRALARFFCNHSPRDHEVSAADRAAAIRPGAPCAMAAGLRHRAPRRARRLDYSTLSDVYDLPGIHPAWIDRHRCTFPVHAIGAVDDLRPCGWCVAGNAGEPAATQLSAVCQDRGSQHPVVTPSLCLPHCCETVRRTAAALELDRNLASRCPNRTHARVDWVACLGVHATDRELRRYDEFRRVPDVLPIIGALPAMEAAGSGCLANLLHLERQPFYSRSRTHPLCGLWATQLAVAGRRDRLRVGRVPAGSPRLQSASRIDRPGATGLK